MTEVACLVYVQFMMTRVIVNSYVNRILMPLLTIDVKNVQKKIKKR